MTGAADSNGKCIGDKIYRNTVGMTGFSFAFCHSRSYYALPRTSFFTCPVCIHDALLFSVML
jgi:hypothetical protein